MHGQYVNRSTGTKNSLDRNTYGSRPGTMQSNLHYNSHYESRETTNMGPKGGLAAFSSVEESSKEQAERNDYLRRSLADADNLSSKSDGSARSRGSRSQGRSKDSRNKKIKKKQKKGVNDASNAGTCCNGQGCVIF